MRLYADVRGSADLKFSMIGYHSKRTRLRRRQTPCRIVQNCIVCQQVQHPGGEGRETLESSSQVMEQPDHCSDRRLLGVLLEPPEKSCCLKPFFKKAKSLV